MPQIPHQKIFDFEKELTKLINKLGIDSDLNIPDHLLSNYLTSCLYIYQNTNNAIEYYKIKNIEQLEERIV